MGQVIWLELARGSSVLGCHRLDDCRGPGRAAWPGHGGHSELQGSELSTAQ